MLPTEFEAKYLNIDKEAMRVKLKNIDATLVRPTFLQKRVVLGLPSGHEIKGGRFRVRDEGDKITLSLKVVDKAGINIDSQKEISFAVSDFDKTVLLLTSIGCQKKAYQENKRELWKLGQVEVTIDEWPFLDPYVEIEGESEEEVIEVSKTLGFDYNQALFCSAGKVYMDTYNLSGEVVDVKIAHLVFNMENPFLE